MSDQKSRAQRLETNYVAALCEGALVRRAPARHGAWLFE